MRCFSTPPFVGFCVFGIPQTDACWPATAHATFAETSCLVHASCLQHVTFCRLGVSVSKYSRLCSPWTIHQPGLGLLQIQELMQALQAREVGFFLGLPATLLGTRALGSVSSPAFLICYVFMKHFHSAEQDFFFFNSFWMYEILVRKYQSELGTQLNRNILLW